MSRIVEEVIRQEARLREVGKYPDRVVLSNAGYKRMLGQADCRSRTGVNTITGLPFEVDHDQKEEVRVVWQ
tara:strand:- start:533 stop:745 length:213 start_codon:yes stop_codon:yes gene_type:complete